MDAERLCELKDLELELLLAAVDLVEVAELLGADDNRLLLELAALLRVEALVVV